MVCMHARTNIYMYGVRMYACNERNAISSHVM